MQIMSVLRIKYGDLEEKQYKENDYIKLTLKEGYF